MTAAFVPPEPPPPQVAEHLRHMTDGHWHDRCRFCRRRRTAPSDSKSGPRGWDKGALGPEPGTSPREKGGTGVLAEDYLPPVHIGAVQDVLVGFRGEPRRYVISGLIGVVFGALNLWVGAYWFGMPFVLSGLIDFWIAWTLWRRRRRGKPSWATGVVRRIGNRLAIVPVPQGAIS